MDSQIEQSETEREEKEEKELKERLGGGIIDGKKGTPRTF